MSSSLYFEKRTIRKKQSEVTKWRRGVWNLYSYKPWCDLIWGTRRDHTKSHMLEWDENLFGFYFWGLGPIFS